MKNIAVSGKVSLQPDVVRPSFLVFLPDREPYMGFHPTRVCA